MNAEQMFKELGYKKSTDIDAIAYSEKLDGTFYRFEITFDLLEKEIVIGTNMEYVIESDLLQAIIQQCKELGWLEDEKQEIKQETNLEHYLEDLLKVGSYFTFMDGKIKHCSGVSCCDCMFGEEDCGNKKFIWLASPYEKPTYKLTKFENDLLQSYLKGHLSGHKFKSILVLNVMKEKGYFKGVDENATIVDILEKCEVI